MTFQKLAKTLCLLEGKKKQVDIAQMSETLKCLKVVFKMYPQGVIEALSPRKRK